MAWGSVMVAQLGAHSRGEGGELERELEREAWLRRRSDVGRAVSAVNRHSAMARTLPFMG